MEDGQNILLTCQAVPSTNLTTAQYAWSIDGDDQSAQNSNTLTRTVDIHIVETYRCRVSEDGGTQYSSFSNDFKPLGEARHFENAHYAGKHKGGIFLL